MRELVLAWDGEVGGQGSEDKRVATAPLLDDVASVGVSGSGISWEVVYLSRRDSAWAKDFLEVVGDVVEGSGDMLQRVALGLEVDQALLKC